MRSGDAVGDKKVEKLFDDAELWIRAGLEALAEARRRLRLEAESAVLYEDNAGEEDDDWDDFPPGRDMPATRGFPSEPE